MKQGVLKRERYKKYKKLVFDTLYWEKENWKIMKNLPENIIAKEPHKWNYRLEISKNERISILELKNSGYSIIQKFKFLDKKWFLIHYQVNNF